MHKQLVQTLEQRIRESRIISKILFVYSKLVAECRVSREAIVLGFVVA